MTKEQNELLHQGHFYENEADAKAYEIADRDDSLSPFQLLPAILVQRRQDKEKNEKSSGYEYDKKKQHANIRFLGFPGKEQGPPELFKPDRVKEERVVSRGGATSKG